MKFPSERNFPPLRAHSPLAVVRRRKEERGQLSPPGGTGRPHVHSDVTNSLPLWNRVYVLRQCVGCDLH